jgi:hypothetical protein
MSRRYKFQPRPPAEYPEVDDLADIIDEKWNIAIRTVQKIRKFKLSRTVTPVLSIPLYWNKNLKAFELGYYPAVQLQNKTPEIINPATEDTLSSVLANVKALVDDSIKGVLRSLGDAGANPANSSGKTVLSRLYSIEGNTYATQVRFGHPSDAETFTTTPLGANAVYYSPSRDFLYSRLGHAGCIGIADQPSATDGVYAQLSLNNTNWDYKGACTTASANVGVSLLQTVYASYLRFVWTNGATAQTVFRFGGRYFI